MTSLRRLLAHHRGFAAGMIALALLMRLLVPAGFMPMVSRGGIVITLCTGRGPAMMAMPDMPGMTQDAGKSDRSDPDHAAKDMPCGFSGLAAPTLGAADPILPVMPVAIVLAAVFRFAVDEARAASDFLRPPLRGPPASIA